MMKRGGVTRKKSKTPVFILHLSEAKERLPQVKAIQAKTGGKIFHGIKLTNGVDGCTHSHLKLYRAGKGPIIVFEDDCEILRDDIFTLVDKYQNTRDIIYFGVNSINKNGTSYGTHGMWISSRAREAIANENPPAGTPIDKLWTSVIKKKKLRIHRPSNIHMYIRQKVGLKSYATGKTWKNYGHKVQAKDS